MLKIHDVQQGSPEWFAARLGIPTASEFQCLLVNGKGEDGLGVGARTYLHKLAGERLLNTPMASYTNPDMERGKLEEDAARLQYQLWTNSDCQQVGFISNGRGEATNEYGYSPDSLVGNDGAVEIKSALPHILIGHVMALKSNPAYFPAEHVAQCQGGLWVAEREWIDLVIFCPGLHMFVQRVTRDELYIRRLSTAVHAFREQLDMVVNHMKVLDGTLEESQPQAAAGGT